MELVNGGETVITCDFDHTLRFENGNANTNTISQLRGKAFIAYGRWWIRKRYLCRASEKKQKRTL